MIKGQRFFQVIEPKKEPCFFGGLAEVSREYNLNYVDLTKEFRSGKTMYKENGIEIKEVYFRIKK